MDDATLDRPTDESQDPRGNLVRIVEALAPVLGRPGDDPVPLNGGITNRNFRARFGDRDYVIRLPGKDTALLAIDRGTERAANSLAARLGFAPEVAAWLDEPQCIVTVFVEGETMGDAALRREQAIDEVAAALRALHESGEELASSFSSFRIVELYARTALERGGEVPHAYRRAGECAAAIEAALQGPEHHPVPCHNDMLAANFIRADAGLVLVDWEYAGMGDRYFDLANFAVNNGLDEPGEERLLAAYWGEEASREQRAALRLMRVMSDFREAMWGVVQSRVSELEFDFGDYADRHFARLLEAAGEPGFSALIQEARGSAG